MWCLSMPASFLFHKTGFTKLFESDIKGPNLTLNSADMFPVVSGNHSPTT